MFVSLRWTGRDSVYTGEKETNPINILDILNVVRKDRWVDEEGG